MTALKNLWDRFKVWIILAGMALVAAFFAMRKMAGNGNAATKVDDMMKTMDKQQSALRERTAARKLVAAVGEQQAIQKIEEKHKETINALDEQAKAKAQGLQNDPVALASFLTHQAIGMPDPGRAGS